MKTFKSILIATTAIALSACSSTYEFVNKEQETILSLATDHKNIYILGEKYDYQFSKKDNQSITKLVLSPYISHVKVLEISAGRIINQTTAEAELTLYVSPADLTEQQQQDLLQNFGFLLVKDISANSGYWQEPKLVSSLKKTPNLLRYDHEFINGKVIKINNRESFIEKASLTHSIQFNVAHLKSEKELQIGNTVDRITQPIVDLAAVPILFTLGYYK